MRRFRFAAVLFVFAAVFLAACGDDDGGSLEDAVDEAQSQDSSDSTDGGDSSDSGDTGDTVDPGDLPEEAQDALDDLEEAQDQLDEELGDLPDVGDLPEGEDIPDLGGLGDCIEWGFAYAGIFLGGLGLLGGDEGEVEEMQAELEEMQASVPDEIADDFVTVSDAYSEYFEELANSTLSEMGDLEDPITADPEVSEANDRINAWLEEECSG